MFALKEHQIVRDWFTQSDCFKSAKKTLATGIQVHSVGSKGTLMTRWKSSWNRPGRDVCAGYLIDINGIYEILPEGKRCWLSGSGSNGNANNTHLGFEICEPLKDTPENAADLYGKTLFLCVYLCKRFAINPANVMAHYELHAAGLASNHADVRHWWGRKGTPWEQYTMERLRSDIAKELGWNALDTMPVLSKGARDKDYKAPYVTTLQNLLVAKGFTLPTKGVDGWFGNETMQAVKDFQTISDVAVTGICDRTTWTKLLDDGPEDQPETEQPGQYTVTIPGLTSAQADALLAAHPGATKAVG